MNFGEIKLYIRSFAEGAYHAGKMSDDKQMSLEDSMVERFINEGYKLFVTTARCYKKVETVTTVALQQEYALPVGLSQIINVFYSAGADKWKLRQTRDDEQLWWELLSNDSPAGYSTQYGQAKVNLYPPPKNAGEILSIYGSFVPDDMVNDGETPYIPTKYHQALCDYGLFRVMQMVGLIDQTKVAAQQQFEYFRQSFLATAEKCRQETEFTGNEMLKFRDGTDFDDNYFTYPHFDHNPIIGTLKFTNAYNLINTVNNELIDGGEDYSPITITSDNFDYVYTAASGMHYELFIYAIRGSEAGALLNLDIEQWSTTITGVGASKTVKIDKKVKNTGLDILLSVTILGTAVTVNVLNANGGTLKFKVRNKVTI